MTADRIASVKLDGRELTPSQFGFWEDFSGAELKSGPVGIEANRRSVSLSLSLSLSLSHSRIARSLARSLARLLVRQHHLQFTSASGETIETIVDDVLRPTQWLKLQFGKK